jgi:hypothetical protein
MPRKGKNPNPAVGRNRESARTYYRSRYPDESEKQFEAHMKDYEAGVLRRQELQALTPEQKKRRRNLQNSERRYFYGHSEATKVDLAAHLEKYEKRSQVRKLPPKQKKLRRKQQKRCNTAKIRYQKDNPNATEKDIADFVKRFVLDNQLTMLTEYMGGPVADTSANAPSENAERGGHDLDDGLEGSGDGVFSYGGGSGVGTSADVPGREVVGSVGLESAACGDGLWRYVDPAWLSSAGVPDLGGGPVADAEFVGNPGGDVDAGLEDVDPAWLSSAGVPDLGGGPVADAEFVGNPGGDVDAGSEVVGSVGLESAACEDELWLYVNPEWLPSAGVPDLGGGPVAGTSADGPDQEARIKGALKDALQRQVERQVVLESGKSFER